MQWVSALRSYLASPAHVKQKIGGDVFKRAAHIHLFVPQGQKICAQSLLVLRQLRWEIMKYGTVSQKARMFEIFLSCYGRATRSHTHDSMISNCDGQRLTLEQIQCVVEARIMGVPLRAVHYRFLFQSPHLSKLGADMPLLLLREIQLAENELAVDVALDVGAGLAANNHWRETLALIPRGHLFGLVKRIAFAQCHGWQCACRFVSHMNEPRAAAQSGDTLNCVLFVYALLWRVSRDPLICVKMHDFIREYTERHGGEPLPTPALNFFISCCSLSKWEVAIELVQCRGNAPSPLSSAALGRLMGLLGDVQQWEKVLLLYQASPFMFAFNRQRHITVHNHALVATAKGGLWKESLKMFNRIPSKNVHTYVSWLSLVLLEGRIPFSVAWESCLEAFQRVERPDWRLGDILVYNLAEMNNWETAIALARMSSKLTPQTLLIALALAVKSSNSETAMKISLDFLGSPRGISAKQVCLVLVIVGCYVRDIPNSFPTLLADALHRCVESQRQFDEAVYYMSQRMAKLLYNSAAPPASPRGTEVLRLFDLLPAAAGGAGCEKACWTLALTVMQEMSLKGWSLASVAPAMLSSGFSASVAIHFLPV
uniref:Pentatricopeptide repeat-containing protein n=1 Tax=Trypanosoma congolense (strain IL3000) TaxID=1068625 RepID=G0UXI3_TRYCI|nr:conserved hypothetical protein [Trypanosoma congolense IL3000]